MGSGSQGKKRIRLSPADCQMIKKALDFYEQNSKGEIYDGENWREDSARLRVLQRRFHCLSTDDDFYARSPRK